MYIRKNEKCLRVLTNDSKATVSVLYCHYHHFPSFLANSWVSAKCSTQGLKRRNPVWSFISYQTSCKAAHEFAHGRLESRLRAGFPNLAPVMCCISGPPRTIRSLTVWLISIRARQVTSCISLMCQLCGTS